MIVLNIYLADKLMNGSEGTIIDFIYDKEKITRIVVEFDDKTSGIQRRQKQSHAFKQKYPTGTPIDIISFDFNISKQAMSDG